jgi:hypothetical protein
MDNYGHLVPGATEAAVDRLDATGRNRTDKRGYGQARNPAYPLRWWS